MTTYEDEMVVWSAMMKYNGHLQSLFIPYRNKEQATDRRTRQYVTTQTVWRANCSLSVSLSSPGVK